MSIDGDIKQVAPSPTQSSCYIIDIQPAQGLADAGTAVSRSPEESHVVSDASSILQFNFCSDLLTAVPREAALVFLHHMKFSRIKQGERFIRQGDKGDFFYLILQGTCMLNVEKNNVLYNVGQLGPGDAAGESALLGNEPQKAHVDAETHTDLLGMSREEYESLSAENPELRNFLSAVLARRLEHSKVTDERKIGKYSVTEKIGQGGSSIIYKGVHGMLGMPVAIKMLKHEMAMDPDFLEIFRNEAKTIAQFNHPNIVKVYDIEEVYHTLFIIMEYLDGILLKNMLSPKKKLTVPKIVDITMQVCYGLEYAHNQGIIHQDVNPGNIFIQPDGRVKIIDFGLAIRRGGVDTNFLFPGTIYYISPEQLKGEPVDERSDIYSLGMTVYEMTTGKRPFPGCHMKTIVDWHLHEEIPDSRITMVDLPDELHAFFRRTIRKDPAERYNNITEALKELRPLAERLGVNEQPCFCRQNKMMGMFLMYQEEEQLALKRLIEEFSRNVSETGAVLRITRFDDA